MESLESKQLATIRKCIECKASKDASCFYAKAVNRLDTVCKDCRKRHRNARYAVEKKVEIAKVEKEFDVILDGSEQKVMSLSGDEFHNLVDAFSILLNIERRLKGGE